MNHREIKALYPKRKCFSCNVITESHEWPEAFIFQKCEKCAIRFKFYSIEKQSYVAPTTVSYRMKKHQKRAPVQKVPTENRNYPRVSALSLPRVNELHQGTFRCSQCNNGLENAVLMHLRMEESTNRNHQNTHLGHEIWCSNCTQVGNSHLFYSLPLEISAGKNYNDFAFGEISQCPLKIRIMKQIALNVKQEDVPSILPVLKSNEAYSALSQRRIMNTVYGAIELLDDRICVDVSPTNDAEAFCSQKGFLSAHLKLRRHLKWSELQTIVTPYINQSCDYKGNDLCGHFKNVVNMTYRLLTNNSTVETDSTPHDEEFPGEEPSVGTNHISQKPITLNELYRTCEQTNGTLPMVNRHTHKNIYANDETWIRVAVMEKTLNALHQFHQKWNGGLSPYTPFVNKYWKEKSYDLLALRSHGRIPHLFLTFTTPETDNQHTSQNKNPILGLSWYNKFKELERSHLGLKAADNCFGLDLSQVTWRAEASKNGAIHFHCLISFHNPSLFQVSEHINGTVMGCGKRNMSLVRRLQKEHPTTSQKDSFPRPLSDSTVLTEAGYIYKRCTDEDRYVREYIPSLLMQWRCRMDAQVIGGSRSGTTQDNLVEHYISKPIPQIKNTSSSVSSSSNDFEKEFQLKDGDLVSSTKQNSKQYVVTGAYHAPSTRTIGHLYNMSIPPVLGVLYLNKSSQFHSKGATIQKLPAFGSLDSETKIFRLYLDRHSDLERYNICSFAELFQILSKDVPKYGKPIDGTTMRRKKTCVTRSGPLKLLQYSKQWKQMGILSFPWRRETFPGYNDAPWEELVLLKCEEQRLYTLEEAIKKVQKRDGLIQSSNSDEDLPTNDEFEEDQLRLQSTLLKGTSLSNSKLGTSPIRQTPAQAAVYHSITDKIRSNGAPRIAVNIIHGPGGCGKSQIISRLREHCIEELVTLTVCCYTGVAAHNLNAMFARTSEHLLPQATTIHSFLAKRRGFTTGTSRISMDKPIELFIVDEFSMIGRCLFDELLNAVVAHNAQFPGNHPVLFLFVGDCFQLGPVHQSDSMFTSNFFSTSSNIDVSWFSMDTERNLRATSIDYESFLRRIRLGSGFATTDDLKYISTRQIHAHSLKSFLVHHSSQSQHISILTDTNREKQKWNDLFKKCALKEKMEMHVLDSIICTMDGVLLHPVVQEVHEASLYEMSGGADVEYQNNQSIDHFISQWDTKPPTANWRRKYMNTTDSSMPRASYARLVSEMYEALAYKSNAFSSPFHESKASRVASLNESSTFAYPLTLTLWIGAYVRLLKNIAINEGLTNGTEGTVQKLEYTENGQISSVVVKFDTVEKPVAIRRVMEEHVGSNGSIFVQVQFPIVLCFASTIHKAQGSTITRPLCVVSFDKRSKKQENPALFYVALSRFHNAPFLVNFSLQHHVKVRHDAFGMLMRFQANDWVRDVYRRYLAMENEKKRDTPVITPLLMFSPTPLHPSLPIANRYKLTQTSSVQTPVHCITKRQMSSFQTMPRRIVPVMRLPLDMKHVVPKHQLVDTSGCTTPVSRSTSKEETTHSISFQQNTPLKASTPLFEQDTPVKTPLLMFSPTPPHPSLPIAPHQYQKAIDNSVSPTLRRMFVRTSKMQNGTPTRRKRKRCVDAGEVLQSVKSPRMK